MGPFIIDCKYRIEVLLKIARKTHELYYEYFKLVIVSATHIS